MSTDSIAELLMPKTMGELMQRIREARGLTQKEAAALLRASGVEATHTLVSKWETNKRQPNMEQILNLAEIYDCKVWDLGATVEMYPRLARLQKLLDTRVSYDSKVRHLEAVASRAGPPLPVGRPIQPPLTAAVSSSMGQNKHRRSDD